jgi:transposase
MLAMKRETGAPTSEPSDWREGRRLRAWELHEQGWQNKRIAEVLGVSKGAVSQWLKRGREGGKAALHKRLPPGAIPRLTDEQRGLIPSLLKRGAQAYGFVGDVWSQKRIAIVLQREFGVSYHHDHIGRLLRQIGWSVQQPVERALERNDEAIERWREQAWPLIKKKLPTKSEPSCG